NPSAEVLGLTDDSRQVKPGWVFVAVPGTREDGTRYAADALRAGAAAVVAERLPGTVLVPNARAAAARLACRFYGDPSSRLRLIGVTGTNGKTTVTYLLERIFAAAGANVGVIGTVAYRYGGRSEPAGQTTPLPISLQALLARMRDAGVDTVAMEVSSHALALDRARGCRFDVGIFTNLTQARLDFHGTLDDYFDAKRKLFEMLNPESGKPYPSAAVVNADDPRAAALTVACRVPVVLYGFSEQAAVRASDVQGDLAKGASFTLDTPAGRAPVRLALLGRHNVSNALAAAAAALTQHVPLEAIVRGLESTTAVPGRVGRVDAGRPVAVLVAYAHPPAA
ncbi:MAG: UDP-N-acetylmuramyl-tripeptide synthetase, partial [bacterium]